MISEKQITAIIAGLLVVIIIIWGDYQPPSVGKIITQSLLIGHTIGTWLEA